MFPGLLISISIATTLLQMTIIFSWTAAVVFYQVLLHFSSWGTSAFVIFLLLVSHCICDRGGLLTPNSTQLLALNP